jgi:thiamine biosynthesis protein ThiI
VVPQAIPLLRPLLTYDKEEIVLRARMIGTFRDNAGDLGCAIVPKHPSTGAKPEEIREDELCIPLEDILKEALAHATVVQAYNGKIIEEPSP